MSHVGLEARITCFIVNMCSMRWLKSLNISKAQAARVWQQYNPNQQISQARRTELLWIVSCNLACYSFIARFSYTMGYSLRCSWWWTADIGKLINYQTQCLKESRLDIKMIFSSIFERFLGRPNMPESKFESIYLYVFWMNYYCGRTQVWVYDLSFDS